jgi:hypothetical protein
MRLTFSIRETGIFARIIPPASASTRSQARRRSTPNSAPFTRSLASPIRLRSPTPYSSMSGSTPSSKPPRTWSRELRFSQNMPCKRDTFGITSFSIVFSRGFRGRAASAAARRAAICAALLSLKLRGFYLLVSNFYFLF